MPVLQANDDHLEVDECFLVSAQAMGLDDDLIIGTLIETNHDYEEAASRLIQYAQTQKDGTAQALPSAYVHQEARASATTPHTNGKRKVDHTTHVWDPHSKPAHSAGQSKSAKPAQTADKKQKRRNSSAVSLAMLVEAELLSVGEQPSACGLKGCISLELTQLRVLPPHPRDCACR